MVGLSPEIDVSEESSKFIGSVSRHFLSVNHFAGQDQCSGIRNQAT